MRIIDMWMETVKAQYIQCCGEKQWRNDSTVPPQNRNHSNNVRMCLHVYMCLYAYVCACVCVRVRVHVNMSVCRRASA